VSLVTILDQAADQIREALDNDVWEFQVEPWRVTSPTLPCVDMYYGGLPTALDAAAFGETLEEMSAGFVLVVRLRFSTNDQEGNQDVHYALVDPSDEHCLVQALYDEPTLDGWASDVNLISDSGLTSVQDLDGAAFYGNVWRFLVIPAVS
jgi:hypothetical protein